MFISWLLGFIGSFLKLIGALLTFVVIFAAPIKTIIMALLNPSIFADIFLSEGNSLFKAIWYVINASTSSNFFLYLSLPLIAIGSFLQYFSKQSVKVTNSIKVIQ